MRRNGISRGASLTWDVIASSDRRGQAQGNKEPAMNNSLLRNILAVDALTCMATGLVLSTAASSLAGPLGLSAELLRGAGLSLFPFAVFLAYLAKRSEIPAKPVWIAVALNLLWVIDSVLLFAWTAPTALGYAFVSAQALAVLVISGLEIAGLKRLSFAA
jgi:hypothetical protein